MPERARPSANSSGPYFDRAALHVGRGGVDVSSSVALTRGLFCRARPMAESSDPGSEPATDPGMGGLDERHADRLEEPDLGLFEFARRLDVAGLGRQQPLVGLLLVGLVQRAALDALADLRQHALVKLHVLRGIGDDPGLQQILEIVLDHGERDDLRALEHPEGSAVDPRRLTVHLGAPRAEV